MRTGVARVNYMESCTCGYDLEEVQREQVYRFVTWKCPKCGKTLASTMISDSPVTGFYILKALYHRTNQKDGGQLFRQGREENPVERSRSREQTLGKANGNGTEKSILRRKLKKQICKNCEYCSPSYKGGICKRRGRDKKVSTLVPVSIFVRKVEDSI